MGPSTAPGATLPEEGRGRAVVAEVRPCVDGGRFPVKRVEGDLVHVEAVVFSDGHDALQVRLLHRAVDAPVATDPAAAAAASWQETPMAPRGNDRWSASFPLPRRGRYVFAVEAWVDPFRTWRDDLRKRVDAGSVEPVDLRIGAALVEAARGPPELDRQANVLVDGSRGLEERARLALGPGLLRLMDEHAPRRFTVRSAEVPVRAGPQRAQASAWYEMFPRSASPEPGRPGTLRDVEGLLPYVKGMGFDVLYLPPIHPIGRTARKGRGHAPTAADGDPGSPWAIGAADGGHRAVAPELGTLEDYRRLVATAREQDIDVAFDLALQCSPDHPWVTEHPEWFRHRPDGSIQYAENPPKKYQDIYPLDFETEDWEALWREILDVVRFWIGQGVRLFRVDNPHTKPFAFWEWLIAAVEDEHPDVLFLAEAFTRPAVMHRLAKVGFSHSYTYFAWRNTKQDLERYFTELTQTEVRDFMRPHLWPNTPDILTETLQTGGRAAFVSRLVLAATLGANYGIYGPPFELMDARPWRPGSEEYEDSEKFAIRHWDRDDPRSLAPLIARLNRIRRDEPALLRDDTLRFHATDNPQIVAYSKSPRPGARAVAGVSGEATGDASGDATGAADGAAGSAREGTAGGEAHAAGETADGTVLCIVNLDPHHRHAGWVHLDLAALGLDDRPFQVHDLLGGGRYAWQGPRNYVELDPGLPAHVFRVRRRIRTEEDFPYYA